MHPANCLAHVMNSLKCALFCIYLASFQTGKLVHKWAIYSIAFLNSTFVIFIHIPNLSFLHSLFSGPMSVELPL